MDQPPILHRVVGSHEVTYIGVPQSEGNDWNGYNYMPDWSTNSLYITGTSAGNDHHGQQAVVTQGTPVCPSHLSDAQGYQRQSLHQPSDSNDGIHSPPEEDNLECCWLGQDGKSPCGQKFSDRMKVLKHLNHVHGVNGSARRDITCRWLPRSASSVCGRHLKRSNVSRHVDVHLGQTILCPYLGCGKSYSRGDSLRKHMKAHSGGNFNAQNVDV
ncbi:hypothetical protein SCLCIDRAFT_1216379 [Scleroderma citrinum Foug A]|uniref:C2H2-type domain-containing protein n=1 Tax=Scleroderma citrinum Foug A TaxID=1036808 RepID=A0A0C3DXG2_9AGAM|nr:hypothetical protein SCLCIDRAFT_1216379 [Scleroderma citrinum Foug A]